jgi:hypothetical protein
MKPVVAPTASGRFERKIAAGIAAHPSSVEERQSERDRLGDAVEHDPERQRERGAASRLGLRALALVAARMG